MSSPLKQVKTEQAARQSATVAERLTPPQVNVVIDHYSAGIMAYESQMMANFIQYHDQGGLEAVTAAKRIDGIALRELWAGACKIKEHLEGSNKFVAKLDAHLTRILSEMEEGETEARRGSSQTR